MVRLREAKRFFLGVCSILVMPFGGFATDVLRDATFVSTITGSPFTGSVGVQTTTAGIMSRHAFARPRGKSKKRPLMMPFRDSLPQNPMAPRVAAWPIGAEQAIDTSSPARGLVIPLSFIAAELDLSNEAYPPDTMGVVGPTQFTLAINGLLKTFNKTTGVADGILNVNSDSFFLDVSDGEFTSDPRIRYDRLTDRWFVVMLNVPSISVPNRLMVAVSNTGIITNATVWTFFSIAMSGDDFFDYPTLGIDQYALYVGGNIFSASTGDFTNCRAYAINKTSVLGTGPITGVQFANVIDATTFVGPFTPQGVDNFDVNPTHGYFVGVDASSFGALVIGRINQLTPSIGQSMDMLRLAVPSTQYPILVPHQGNTNGRAGNLDAIDDRLFMAHIRNNQLWTAHNLGVDNNGVSSQAVTTTRNGSRWYQIDVLGNPALVQSGTLFQSTGTNTTSARSYWMPSVMTSGAGHMVLGCSVASSSEFINAAFANRFATDSFGTLQFPTLYTTSSTAYNPPGDPGDPQGGRRWGDFSYVSLDPSDNMTMWVAQEYCSSTNKWGIRVGKLLAPPPASLVSVTRAALIVHRGRSLISLNINGQSVNGSGFYDPGVGFTKRLQVAISGGVKIKSVQYVNPTLIKVNISTVGVAPGNKNITVTNPDGQSAIGVGLLKVI